MVAVVLEVTNVDDLVTVVLGDYHRRSAIYCGLGEAFEFGRVRGGGPDQVAAV